MEWWVESNIIPIEYENIDELLLTRVKVLVDFFKNEKMISTWHFIRGYAPLGVYHIRLRLRTFDKEKMNEIKEKINSFFDPLKENEIQRHYFGCDGVEGAEYEGDEGDYGERCWEVIQKYLEYGSELTLEILERRPLEKGDRFHVPRFFHMFANQLGHTIPWEVEVFRASARSLAARIL